MKLPASTEIIDLAGNSHLVYSLDEARQMVRDALEAAAIECGRMIDLHQTHSNFICAKAIRNLAKGIV